MPTASDEVHPPIAFLVALARRGPRFVAGIVVGVLTTLSGAAVVQPLAIPGRRGLGDIALIACLAIFGIIALIVVVPMAFSFLAPRVAKRIAERTPTAHPGDDGLSPLERRVRELEDHVDVLTATNLSLVTTERTAMRARGDAIVALAERTRHTELFEAALRTVPIAMAIIDPDLRYIRVNAACAAMTGLPIDAHAGRGLRDVNPLLAPELETAMRRVLATGEPCLNYRLTRPTPHAPGGVLEITMHITAFHTTSGRIAGICSTATDMTAWKRLQDQFFQAQKLEAVGQLAAGIAHDFNNLVTVMASYCDLMLMELPAASQYRHDVEEIRSAADRATTLARRMLGTVRNSAMVPTPIDMRETVFAARDLVKHATRGIVTIGVSCAESTGSVLADAIQIEQVLLNLVINAVDAMPAGGEIAIQTEAVALTRKLATRVGEIPAGDYVELTVSDNGSGMDATTLARIFEPFFTTKPRGKGTGLGLATVLGITRELGGGVEVSSTPGAGASFRILIPRVSASADSNDQHTPGRGLPAIPRGSETLLLVNDEDVPRAGVARILSRQGYRVLEARHGGEALRMLADEEQIDLVVSDLHMPGVSGQELSQRLRALGKRTPVLFMSGASLNASPEGSLTHPLDDDDECIKCISEPFEADYLLSAVREMLKAV